MTLDLWCPITIQTMGIGHQEIRYVYDRFGQIRFKETIFRMANSLNLIRMF